jgi:hypothetical protein
VLSSATLKPAIQEFLFTQSHWVDRGKDAVKMFEGSQALDPRATTIRHCAVYVDVNGGMRNVVRPEDDEEELEGGDPRLKGMSRAIEIELDEEVEEKEEPEEEMDEETGLAPSWIQPPVSIMSRFVLALRSNIYIVLWGGKTLPPQLIDAVASTFALDVPFQALLILPNPVSAAKTVETFQELEIKAVHLDSYLATRDGAKLLQPFSATSYKKHKEKLQSSDDSETRRFGGCPGPSLQLTNAGGRKPNCCARYRSPGRLSRIYCRGPGRASGLFALLWSSGKARRHWGRGREDSYLLPSGADIKQIWEGKEEQKGK